MSMSAIDKRIKNARLAVDRARDPETVRRARKDLAHALRLKDQWKATKR
ncbi:hypothetical protein [Dietzia alimentaria]|nr:hypothetical protein [Dietzia alimentaria]